MANNNVRKITNPFQAIPAENLAPQLKPIEYEKEREVYNLIPKACKVMDDDGVQQDIIRYEPTFIKKYDIQEYIKSFESDIGIQNILKKVALTGDKSYLNQTGRVGEKPDGGLEDIKDYTNVPANKTEAFNAVAAGVAAYDALPDDMKADMSFAQFAEKFGEEQIKSYVDNLIKQYEANKKPQEEGK